MPKYTTAYSDFSDRLSEVSMLRKIASSLERKGPVSGNGEKIDAICRGSLVLLSSHVEAYVKEVGECLLDKVHEKQVCRSKIAPQFFYWVSQSHVDAFRSTTQPEGLSQHIHKFVESDADLWVRLGPFPSPLSAEVFNKGFSNPTFEKVKAYFHRFGYSDFRRDFMRRLNSKGILIENSINSLVGIRNQIAHGDPSAKKTPSEVAALEADSKVFCRTIDSVFGTWCKKNLCSIR